MGTQDYHMMVIAPRYLIVARPHSQDQGATRILHQRVHPGHLLCSKAIGQRTSLDHPDIANDPHPLRDEFVLPSNLHLDGSARHCILGLRGGDLHPLGGDAHRLQCVGDHQWHPHGGVLHPHLYGGIHHCHLYGDIHHPHLYGGGHHPLGDGHHPHLYGGDHHPHLYDDGHHPLRCGGGRRCQDIVGDHQFLLQKSIKWVLSLLAGGRAVVAEALSTEVIGL